MKHLSQLNKNVLNIEHLEGCEPVVYEFMAFISIAFGTTQVYVTSGFRDADYNKEIGGSPTSSHVKGLAVDIHVFDVHPYKVAAKAMNFPRFQGLGVNIFKNYIHVDFDTDKGRRYWIYDRENRAV